jgi:hypothetical protein
VQTRRLFVAVHKIDGNADIGTSRRDIAGSFSTRKEPVENAAVSITALRRNELGVSPSGSVRLCATTGMHAAHTDAPPPCVRWQQLASSSQRHRASPGLVFALDSHSLHRSLLRAAVFVGGSARQ